MIVTIDWMEEWFKRFDQEYFGGKLPLPELSLTRAKTRLGQLAFKRASRWGRTKLYDFKLSMSTYYDMTEQQAKSVLLHEMIHYIIGYTGLKDTSPHGVVFRGMMDNLNRKYGWDIRVMTSTKGWKVSERVAEKKKAKGPQTYLMLAIELKDGKFYLSRVNPGFARRIEKQLPMVRELRSHRWYTTQESYFEDYPQVRSLRGRRITKNDFEKLQNVLTPFEL
ncbi:SprT-like domain-containing protein [Segatella copri]|uniref:SprT-like domain-containing protein n=1 Tax=Segatella copri TaxID=165179 RepID=UPI0019349977|nr:SprT-like domain-containing protein [Segatella copri]MBM0143379.1 SprT family zinc-dependent metalloprotease [Segatella copri]